MMVLVTTKKDCRGFILFKRREMMAKRGGLKTREKKKRSRNQIYEKTSGKKKGRKRKRKLKRIKKKKK